MAGRSYDQRFKSLCVLQILLKYTDNDNPLTIGEIVCKLSDYYGIEANEHSVGRDIKELQRLYEADEDDELIERGSRLPYKIEYDGSGKRGYKVTKRPCRFSDLQLLVECIHSARFISKSEETRLLRMMKEFCSIEQSKTLKTEVDLLDRVKTNNNDIIRYIQVINSAIKNSCKIQFKYMKYTLKNRTEQTPRRNGTHRLPAAVQRICRHHRTTTTAVGVVIGLILLVGSIIPDLMGFDADNATVLGTAQNTVAEHISHRVGKQGHNINSHRYAYPR